MVAVLAAVWVWALWGACFAWARRKRPEKEKNKRTVAGEKGGVCGLALIEDGAANGNPPPRPRVLIRISLLSNL